MDADGEDRPEEIINFIELSDEEEGLILKLIEKAS